MTRIRFDFGTLTLDAELLDTPTARAITAALPISASALANPFMILQRTLNAG